jgi:hypothetical protein
MEIAHLLKEHPDCACVLVTLIQEYQSRLVFVTENILKAKNFYLVFKNHYMLVNYIQ